MSSPISPAPTAVKYSLRGEQLLATGMTTGAKATTDNLWVHSKVYSRGGENELHAHAVEDHTFFVVQGSAQFYFGDGSNQVVERFEGFLIPKGSLYRFHALGEENLVMLRIGAAQRGDDWSGELRNGAPVEIRRALDPAGNPIPSKSLAKGRTPAEPVTPLPGRFFPEN